VEVRWTPILYTDHGGGYEVGYATTENGPYTIAQAADKTSDRITLEGLNESVTYFIAVRSYTPAHDEQQNDLTSVYSPEVTLRLGEPAPVADRSLMRK
jgi:hypothetical protein